MSEETTWIGMRPAELTESQRTRLSQDEVLRRRHLLYLDLGRRMEALPPPSRCPRVSDVLGKAEAASHTLSRIKRDSGASHWLFGLPLLAAAMVLVTLALVRKGTIETETEEETVPHELQPDQEVASELTLEALGSTLMGDRPLHDGGRLEAHEDLLFRVHVLAEGYLQIEETAGGRRLLGPTGRLLEPGTHTLKSGWEAPSATGTVIGFRAFLCPQPLRGATDSMPMGCAMSEISLALGSAD